MTTDQTATPRPEGPEPLPTPTTMDEAIRGRDGWYREAWTYAGNSDYWRERAEKAEAASAEQRVQAAELAGFTRAIAALDTLAVTEAQKAAGFDEKHPTRMGAENRSLQAESHAFYLRSLLTPEAS